MKLFFRRYWLIIAIAAIILYLIIGMMAPFMVIQKVGADYKMSSSVDKYYSDTMSVDRAYIVEDSMDALDDRIRMIEQAKERIILSTFDMRPGYSTTDVLAMILNAADRGVKVQILVDGISGLIRMEGKDLFYAVSSHPGVEVRIYNMPNPAKPWTFHGRMHDKYLIVDDRYYLLGGRNTFDYFLGNYIEDDKSLDREVFIYNTAAGTERTTESSLSELESYFNEMWDYKYCRVFHSDSKLQEKDGVKAEVAALKQHYLDLKKQKPELFAKDDYFDQITVPVNKATLVSNPKDIYGKEPTAWYEMQQLMSHAKERVVLHTPYAVLSDDMYQGMRDISATGVDFTMLINSVENGDNIVASSDYLKNKGRIIDTGVQIYEYDGGESYHGKSILIDDNISIVGSYNLDLRSTYVDTELMLVVDSKELNRQLEGYMDKLQEDSRKVIDKDTYETPAHIKVAEVPFIKKVIWKVLGVVLGPFRVMI